MIPTPPTSPAASPPSGAAGEEARLVQQERFYTALLESSFDGIAVLGPDGRVAWVMPGAERFLGYGSDELLSSGAFELVHPDDLRAAMETLAEVLLRPGCVIETEARFRHKDGSWRRLQVRATNRLEDPAVRGIVLSHREVPEHQQALRALRTSETRYHALVQAMGEGVVVMEEPATIRSANPAAARILGLTLDELQGRTSFDPRWRAIREDGSDFPGEEHPATVTLRTGVPHRDAVMGVHKPDGSLTWISINARLLPDPTSSAPPTAVVTFADITERVNATNRLEEALAQLRRITDTVPGVVFEYLLAADGSQRFPFMSHRAAELLGVESEAIQRDARLAFRSVLPDDLTEMKAKGRAAVEQRASWSHEWRIQRDDGQIHWLSGRASPELRADGSVMWTGFVVDVTHEKRLEMRLSQAQRMESVGRLAGGVAHDFNNLLTVVSGNLELLAARAGWPASLDPYANAIRSAAERGTAFTRQLLTFTRNHATTPRLVDLNELVERILPLLGRLVEERIEIGASLSPTAGWVRGDPAQLEQLLLNLVVNARDAIEGVGRITIETSAVTVTAQQAEDGEVPEGEWSVLAVRDTGCGIPAEIRDQIFEPFFSTKAAGQGTGLGLATCYGVVARAEGRITVESEMGRGSVFRAYLPRIGGASAAENPPPPEPAAVTGRGAVLIVEDDAAVRAVARYTLLRAGYPVLEAADGDEGLEVARRHGGTIEVLLTDLVMQRMGGLELAERLRAERPDIAVVVMSGHALDGATSARIAALGADFLPKPFKPLDLLHRIGPLAGASQR